MLIYIYIYIYTFIKKMRNLLFIHFFSFHFLNYFIHFSRLVHHSIFQLSKLFTETHFSRSAPSFVTHTLSSPVELS